VLSARYGGENLTDPERCARLLEALRETPDERRRARFVAVVALAARGRIVGTWRGEAAGTILREPSGERGFGYDPIFLSDELHVPFARLLPAVKRQVSHRGRALALAAAAIRSDPGLLA
jgi:XTP/dITP diphosphohydrolase